MDDLNKMKTLIRYKHMIGLIDKEEMINLSSFINKLVR